MAVAVPAREILAPEPDDEPSMLRVLDTAAGSVVELRLMDDAVVSISVGEGLSVDGFIEMEEALHAEVGTSLITRA